MTIITKKNANKLEVETINIETILQTFKVFSFFTFKNYKRLGNNGLAAVINKKSNR